MVQATFRFLDLPKEIRLMIYEFLPYKTSHYKFGHSRIYGIDRNANERLTLITTSAPVGLLATCRLIHNEAKPTIEKMKQTISANPLKIFATVHFLSEVRSSTGFLTKAILAWAHVLGFRHPRNPIYTFTQTINNVGIYPAPHDAENRCLFEFVNTAAMRLQHSQPIFEIMIPMTEAVRNDLQRELGYFVVNYVRKAIGMLLRGNGPEIRVFFVVEDYFVSYEEDSAMQLNEDWVNIWRWMPFGSLWGMAQFRFRAEEEVEEWKGIEGEWH